jgi:hypothetical protein
VWKETEIMRCERTCVCVWERERERVSKCVCVRERERECVCLCTCVPCMREKNRIICRYRLYILYGTGTLYHLSHLSRCIRIHQLCSLVMLHLTGHNTWHVTRF